MVWLRSLSISFYHSTYWVEFFENILESYWLYMPFWAPFLHCLHFLIILIKTNLNDKWQNPALAWPNWPFLPAPSEYKLNANCERLFKFRGDRCRCVKVVAISLHYLLPPHFDPRWIICFGILVWNFCVPSPNGELCQNGGLWNLIERNMYLLFNTSGL